MTNEEIKKRFEFDLAIKKRFEFDLEMGRFKFLNDEIKCFAFDCDYKEKLKHFEKFLLDIGYVVYATDDVDMVFMYNTSRHYGIGIDCENKEYWCYSIPEDSSHYNDKDNDIPEYIFEYEVVE